MVTNFPTSWRTDVVGGRNYAEACAHTASPERLSRYGLLFHVSLQFLCSRGQTCPFLSLSLSLLSFLSAPLSVVRLTMQGEISCEPRGGVFTGSPRRYLSYEITSGNVLGVGATKG